MRPNKTIVHVTQCFGGVETYLVGLLVSGALDDYQTKILVAPCESPLTKLWTSAGGQVIYVPMVRDISPVRDLTAIWTLSRLLFRARPSVLHLHSSKAGAVGRVAASLVKILRRDIRVVYTPHAFFFLGQSGWRRKAFLQIERALRPLTDYLLGTSPSEAARATDEVNFSVSKVAYALNGVDVDVPIRAHDATPSLRAVFVGRVCYQKNVDLLTKIMSGFSLDSGIHFSIIGIGHYEDDVLKLNALLEANGVDRRIVEVVPWMAHGEVLQRFAKSDVCIVTSRYESFGYVAAEASAAGLPTLVSNVDGLKDIVVDGVSGYIVASDDPAEWQSKLRSLRDNLSTRLDMASAARERAVSVLSLQISSRAVQEFYRSAEDA